jgi:hypothetical protein
MNFVILYRSCVTNEHWYAWFVLIAVNFICLCAWLVTMCDIWPVVNVSCIMKSLVEKDLIYHLEPLCPTPVLMALMLLKHYASNENDEFPCVLSLFYRCPSVFRLWVHRGFFPAFLILIGSQIVIVFSTYFIFVVLWIIIRLHQSKQAHSIPWQALLICKYQIISIFPCWNLQSINMFSQWYFLYSKYQNNTLLVKRLHMSTLCTSG